MTRASLKSVWLAAVVIVLTAALPAQAETFGQGKAAFLRGRYVEAAQVLAPIAARGNPQAQAMLGFMYENGLGAPQDYDAAVDLYCRAAERGNTTGQYLLGLMYDKGHGVDRDEVLAYKWLSLAAAAAPASNRENYVKIRNAVASKMSLGQIRRGQWLARNWRPTP